MRARTDKLLSIIIIISMSALVIDVLLQVFSGFLIKNSNPFNFTSELAEFLLIWVGLLGAAYASGKKQHLSIDLINKKLSEKHQRRLAQFINILVFLFSAFVLIVGGIRFVYINMKLEQISSALQIPMYWVYLVLPLSGLFICYYAIDDIFKEVGRKTETGERKLKSKN